jgi:L-threonylcarbamoyladenylate synthase
MSRVFRLTGEEAASKAAALAAADALTAGGLVVFPTETVYGLAAVARDADATARVFAAKRRAADLALPVMAATGEAALALGSPDPRADALAAAFWPGPLTIVVPRGAASRAWSLGDRPDSIAVRVPDHPVALAVLRRTPPLAVTSANLSGSPPARTLDELERAFGPRVAVFVTLIRPLRQEDSPPSTVLDLTGPESRVVRAGTITEEAIMEVLRRSRPQVTG